MSTKKAGQNGNTVINLKSRKKTVKRSNRARIEDVKNWASASAVVIVIAVTCGISAFGHVQTLGLLALGAVPFSIAMEFYGARLAVHATAAPDKIGASVCILLMVAVAVFNGYCEHRGMEALNEFSSRSYNVAVVEQKAARDTLTRLETEQKSLPRLPSDARELSAYRSRNPETTAFIEAELSTWATENKSALAQSRATMAKPLPARPVAALSGVALTCLIVLWTAIKLLGFWAIRPRDAIVIDFKRKKKPTPEDASAFGSRLAAHRWGNKI